MAGRGIDTHSMSIPASRIILAVPPLPSRRKPSSFRPLAKGKSPVLSYTDSKAMGASDMVLRVRCRAEIKMKELAKERGPLKFGHSGQKQSRVRSRSRGVPIHHRVQSAFCDQLCLVLDPSLGLLVCSLLAEALLVRDPWMGEDMIRLEG